MAKLSIFVILSLGHNLLLSSLSHCVLHIGELIRFSLTTIQSSPSISVILFRLLGCIRIEQFVVSVLECFDCLLNYTCTLLHNTNKISHRFFAYIFVSSRGEIGLSGHDTQTRLPVTVTHSFTLPTVMTMFIRSHLVQNERPLAKLGKICKGTGLCNAVAYSPTRTVTLVKYRRKR